MREGVPRGDGKRRVRQASRTDDTAGTDGAAEGSEEVRPVDVHRSVRVGLRSVDRGGTRIIE